MRRALTWAGGISASLAANGALVVALAAAVAPDPPPQPKAPAPEFDIASYPVPQATAPEATATGEAPPEGVATGTRANGQAVPQLRAVPGAINSESAAAAPTGGAALAGVAPGGVPVAPGVIAAPAALLVIPSGEGVRAAAAPTGGAALAGAAPGGVPVAPGVIAVPAALPVAPLGEGVRAAVPGGAVQAASVPFGTTPGPAILAATLTKAAAPEVQALLAAASLDATAAPSARPPSVVALAAPAVAPVLTGLAPVAAPPVNSIMPVMPAVTGAVPAGAALLSAAPASPVLSAAEEPGGLTAAAEPTLIVLRQESASGAPLALTAPTAPPAPAVAPPAQRQAAALAWSGEAAAALDAVSLAAIEAFAQVGDPAGDGPQVRDAIGDLLARVPCARLQTVFDPATGALELRGHMPEPGLREPVLAALAAQVGGAIPLRDSTLILPRPQCGVLAEIATLGVPQSDEQVGDPRVIGNRPFAAQWDFAEGERLEFRMQAPDYPAYVYVDYYQADGQVFHLQPNDMVAVRLVPAKEMIRTGQRNDGLPDVHFLVTPPFGQEIMVALASSAPLYEGVRPLVEPAADYLTFLQGAVARAQADDPAYRGEWYYFFVSTGP